MEIESNIGESESLEGGQSEAENFVDSHGRTICKWTDPYKADKFEIKNKDKQTEEYLALTRKNAKFIEAVVRLDSNYGWDMVRNPPLSGYVPTDPDKKIKEDFKGKTRYYGSIAYWFNEMKKSAGDSEECGEPKNNFERFRNSVAGAIISIDITNSTRMSYEERRKLIDRIVGETEESSPFKNVKDLIDNLKDGFHPIRDGKFDPDCKKHIFAILCKQTRDKGRYNVSFASKFCSYAAEHLPDLDGNLYSKYDNVVSNHLATYLSFYCPDEPKHSLYDYKVNTQRSKKNSDDYEYRLKVYGTYCSLIGKIISSLDKNNKISRDEFDHIIWYSEK